MTAHHSQTGAISGAGLGLRRELMLPLLSASSSLLEAAPGAIAGPDFLEIAPENWLHIGGLLGEQFQALCARYPVICHGLSLNIGGPAPLDEPFLLELKRFLDSHQIAVYSEHLSYCADHGQLYDLLPLPFTEEAVDYVAARVRRVQDILQRPLILENVSYYARLNNDLSEAEFINAVLDRADCALLLDVNNIYVNSVNHRYCPHEFLRAMPSSRIAYMHIAGHYDEAPDLLVDTHGSNVKSEVWQLLREAYAHAGVVPTLLERDFNIPDLNTLKSELQQIRMAQLNARTQISSQSVQLEPMRESVR